MRDTLFFVGIATGIESTSRADEVYLRNGDRLSGKITKADRHQIRLQADLIGEILLRWAVVERVTTDHPLYATLGDGRVVPGRITLRGEVAAFAVWQPETIVPLNQLRVLRSKDEHPINRGAPVRIRTPMRMPFVVGFVTT